MGLESWRAEMTNPKHANRPKDPFENNTDSPRDICRGMTLSSNLPILDLRRLRLSLLSLLDKLATEVTLINDQSFRRLSRREEQYKFKSVVASG